MRKFYSVAAFALITLLAGCSTTREGMRVGTGGAPSDSDIVKVRDQLVSNARSAAVKSTAADALSGELKVGVTVIGETGVYRKLDAKDKHAYYVEYAKLAEKWHPGAPVSLTEDEFGTEVGGWTTMETYSIPGLMAIKLPVAVRAGDDAKFTFVSTAGAWLVNATGDLIVAHSNKDGILVAEKVLCKDGDKDYRACVSQYEKGRFDLNTGVELGRDMKPKAGGAQIDPVTFKRKTT